MWLATMMEGPRPVEVLEAAHLEARDAPDVGHQEVGSGWPLRAARASVAPAPRGGVVQSELGHAYRLRGRLLGRVALRRERARGADEHRLAASFFSRVRRTTGAALALGLGLLARDARAIPRRRRRRSAGGAGRGAAATRPAKRKGSPTGRGRARGGSPRTRRPPRLRRRAKTRMPRPRMRISRNWGRQSEGWSEVRVGAEPVFQVERPQRTCAALVGLAVSGDPGVLEQVRRQDGREDQAHGPRRRSSTRRSILSMAHHDARGTAETRRRASRTRSVEVASGLAGTGEGYSFVDGMSGRGANELEWVTPGA